MARVRHARTCGWCAQRGSPVDVLLIRPRAGRLTEYQPQSMGLLRT